MRAFPYAPWTYHKSKAHKDSGWTKLFTGVYRVIARYDDEHLGATFSAFTGTLPEFWSGYWVGGFTPPQVITPWDAAEEGGDDRVRDDISRVLQVLRRQLEDKPVHAQFIRVWYSGAVFGLEGVGRFADYDRTIQIARTHNQRTIYDIANHREIKV